MTVTAQQLEAWMLDSEGENLEFKEARTHFNVDRLIEYCVALANERGGKLILGVSDSKPRAVVGTNTLSNIHETKSKVLVALQIRIEIDELYHHGKRVLVISIPSRPIGVPLHIGGKYLMRIGEELRPMTLDQIKAITEESMPDFSATVVNGLDLSSLSDVAINTFREQWIIRSGNNALASCSDERLLSDAGLIHEGNITHAALILFGTEDALRRYLSAAEVIFEYRSDEASTHVNQRLNIREGFFLYFDRLIDTINLRNDEHNYIDGLFRKTIMTFNDRVIREAILNAVSHRDYRLQGSIFVLQYPRKIIVTSPGGFPPGVTVENIIERSVPRNRLIAEAFYKCGFVERSGQGVDRIFVESIKEGKLPPDYSGSDDFLVKLTLNGTVQDENFVRFLEELGKETQDSFVVEDFIALDQIHRNQKVDERFHDRLQHLRDAGAIEMTGKGRGAKYLLSKKYYEFVGKPGKYTRKKGLDDQQNMTLLENHIISNPGCQMTELKQVLSELDRFKILRLLYELQKEDRVHVIGERKAARWYPGPKPET